MASEIPHIDTLHGEEFLPFLEYYVSNKGRVWSNSRNKFICQNMKRYTSNGKRKAYKHFGNPTNAIHHVVMQLFGPTNPRPSYFTDIDHIDHQDWHDNRIENLRWSPRWQNQLNTNSKGWCYRIGEGLTKPYRSQIGTPVKRISLGYYTTPEEAHERYCEARKRAMQLTLLDFVVRTRNSVESFVKTGAW